MTDIQKLVELYNRSEEVRKEILGIARYILDAPIVARGHGVALEALLTNSLDAYFNLLQDDLQTEESGDTSETFDSLNNGNLG